jgi:hypothetical protein
MSDPNESTSTGDGVRLSSSFLEFCVKVRKDDPSILPEPGQPFMIRQLSEKEHIEVADALLENTSVTYLELETEKYTKRCAEAMVKYLRSSKYLQRIRLGGDYSRTDDRFLQHSEEMSFCFLRAFQECTSLKELHMRLSPIGGPSNMAFENMMTNTQS